MFKWIFIVLSILLVLVVSWTKKSHIVCYDSQTINGLGDRLLDICYIMTKSPDSKIRVKWNLGKTQERFVYDINLIKIENGEIITTSLESCTLNLKLEKPQYPGANAPPVEKSDIFKNVAKRIKPTQEVEKVIPKEKYVTIHIRGTDKFSDKEHHFMTTRAQFEEYKTKCIEYVKSHREKNYFVCSDDEELKKKFINECGDGSKFIELEYGNLDRSIVDLFVMSRSELVIQCTRYSTFSMVASIIGGIPLLNFSGDERIGGDVVDWKPFIYKTAV